VNFVRAKSETGKTLKQSVNQRILDQPGVVAPDALSQRIAFIWLSKCIPQLYGIPEAEANSEYFDIEPSPEADRQARVLTIPPIPADFKAKLKAELRQELVVRKSQSFATIGRAQSENFCNRDSQVVGPSVLAKRERVPESVSVSVQSVPPEEPKLKRQRISRETTLVVEEELPQSDNNFDQGPPEPVNPPDNETQPTSSVEDEPLSLPEENPSTNETNVFSTPNFPVKVVKPLGRSLTTGVHSILSDQVKTTLDVQLTEANIEKMNSLQKMVMRVHKEIEDLKNAIQKSEKESYDQSFQLRQELLQLKQTLGDTLCMLFTYFFRLIESLLKFGIFSGCRFST
jgi:hypothetical protein